MTTRTMSEMKTHIAAKAVDDAGFRESLIADPRTAISNEFGIAIPEEFTVQVHEDSYTTAHLTLPPSDGLTEADLERAAGGQDLMRWGGVPDWA